CHIEHGLGYAVCAHLGNAAKDHHVHDDGEDGLDEIPQRSEDRLLVLYYYVALYKQYYEVSVSPELPDVYVPQLVVWTNDHRPRILIVHIPDWFCEES
ncbi:MAG: hypothetical protein J6X12_04590, partial [Paludibacteraceae bacterium]|nr:hypothetical protein [Paludibacteraceae bacterium]